MTDFSDLLAPERVRAGLAVASKKALFQQLGLLAGPALDGVEVAARDIADRLAARERLGSTGFGGGVALPHGKLDGLRRVTGMFASLAHPIDVDAIDGQPVDIVFALLSPPDAGADHLKALARVSRRLRDRAFVDKLRGAGSPDALYALLTAVDQRDAA